MDEKNKILLTDLKTRISHHFIDGGWITISDDPIHSCLVDDDALPGCMKSYQWDLLRGDCGLHEIYDQGDWSYRRIGPAPIEPFVIYRDPVLDSPAVVEIPDDFRLYFNLRLTTDKPEEKVFSRADDNGNWEEVVKIDNIHMKVKALMLRQYMAMREMNLLIFFDEMIYSDKTFKELDVSPVNNQIEQGNDFIYNYTSLVSGFIDGHTKSGGWIMGKCVLRYDKEDYKPDFASYSLKRYESYAIGYDALGNVIEHTCDKDTLSNYFVPNGNEPLEMTPTFFRKNVLDKYYGNPNKYEVQDGIIDCLGGWSLRIDNNQRDYVVVMLVDLGYLPYSEQQYWKTYNEPRGDGMGLSRPTFTRWYEGNFCNPSWPDLYFKFQFKIFNEKWTKMFGWSLFLPLTSKDEHYFKTLHCLTEKNNDQDFEKQIGALAKITIDSLNQKELVKGSDGDNEKVKELLNRRGVSSLDELKVGIDKLECFLYSHGEEVPEVIKYLRDVQTMRSGLVAHRKTSDQKGLDKIHRPFTTEEGTQQIELEQIFIGMVKTLNTLDKLYLK